MRSSIGHQLRISGHEEHVEHVVVAVIRIYYARRARVDMEAERQFGG